jgi:two-component system sensor histidine kinase RegB
MPPATASSTVRPEIETDSKNMQQLVQLRWIAVCGQIATILIVHFGFGIHLPLEPMLALLGCLALFNAASFVRAKIYHAVSNNELFLALLVDVGMLTAQLYLSGGATNPFTFLYLLQVTLSAVLLKAWSTWSMVAITASCMAGLVLFGKPLDLPLDHSRGLHSPYIQGMLICFVLNAALLVIFITRIGRNLRERDGHLADLRQRAAEEEHIVRIGLLASGAAHELGTPLATLAVILGDWKHMRPFTKYPELLQEIDEMQAQVLRCKAIVSNTLLSAGETRGEFSVKTTVSRFLDDLAEEWRATRPVYAFDYANDFGQDLPMVSDLALKQMVYNVLDNALDASPHWLRLDAHRDTDALRLTITDEGPGFAPAMLRHFGKPFQSSKGRTGGGLGLFLVLNVARTLGGNVTASNRPQGGAIVTISLPLAAITVGEATAYAQSSP